jgi:hypothetical protein
MMAASFQPLVPEGLAIDSLLAQAAALIAEGYRLEAAAGQLSATLAPLLRAMKQLLHEQDRRSADTASRHRARVTSTVRR